MENNTMNLPQAKAKVGITSFLNQDNVKNQLNQAVGKNSVRFVSAVVSAVTNTPALQECTNQSILSAGVLKARPVTAAWAVLSGTL